jgi:DNA-binding NarL/FixJ family response regulator
MVNAHPVRNSSDRLRLLVLESSLETAALLTGELERVGFQVVSQRVDSEEPFTRSLLSFAPDLILAAPHLPDFGAVAALAVVQGLRPTAPLIVVSESLDEQTAITCLRAGAEDVVLWRNLSRLGPSIARALNLRQPLRRLSRRQLEVLRLVSEGRTTKQIAERLSVSVKTVETHRGAMTKRLGIREIASQARYAVRVGLVPQGDPRDNEPAAA